MVSKSQLCMTAMEIQPKPQLFLLDDDPIFCKLMSKTARRLGVPLTVCSTLEDFGSKPNHRNFDVALIDYFLEGLTGTDVACLLEERPIFFVSRSEQSELAPGQWPESVKGFLSKALGAEKILAEVCRWQQSEAAEEGYMEGKIR